MEPNRRPRSRAAWQDIIRMEAQQKSPFCDDSISRQLLSPSSEPAAVAVAAVEAAVAAAEAEAEAAEARPLTQAEIMSAKRFLQRSISKKQNDLKKGAIAGPGGCVPPTLPPLNTACYTVESLNREEPINFPSYNVDRQSQRDDSLLRTRTTPSSPSQRARAVDDTAVYQYPTGHVDYLTHEWQEDHLLTSWRHLVSKKKAYSNHGRLENASWRLWAKTRGNLTTIPSEQINWKKDCDVSWLYGPLHADFQGRFGTAMCSTTVQAPSRANSQPLPPCQPILKKRSLSEIMLQRSFSTASLAKEPASPKSPARSLYDSYSASPKSPMRSSLYDNSSSPRSHCNSPASMSWISTASRMSASSDRTVRFHNEVKQCIALDVIADEQEDDTRIYLNMSSKARPRKPPVKRPALKRTRTIEYLQPTTLKSDRRSSITTTERVDSWNPGKLCANTSQGSWNSSLQQVTPNDEADDEEEEIDWFSPTPVSLTINYNALCDRAEELSSMGCTTDEECFEAEMFGSILPRSRSRPSFMDQSTSSIISSDASERRTPSPSSSGYQSGGSNDDDDEDSSLSLSDDYSSSSPPKPSTTTRLPLPATNQNYKADYINSIFHTRTPPRPSPNHHHSGIGIQFTNPFASENAKIADRDRDIVSDSGYESLNSSDRGRVVEKPLRAGAVHAAKFQPSWGSLDDTGDEESWWMNV